MLAAIWIRDRHLGVEEEISKAWIERVEMLRSDREHGLDHRVGKISAARLSGPRLGNVKADIHAIALTMSAQDPGTDEPEYPRCAGALLAASVCRCHREFQDANSFLHHHIDQRRKVDFRAPA